MRIAVCTPCHRETMAVFTQALGRMLIRTSRARPDLELEVFISRGALVLEGRLSLLETARQWSADAILWLDADQHFPPDTLIRLVDRERDIIGCNYARRTEPTGPTGLSSERRPLWTTAEKVAAGEVEEAALIGFGVCLVKMPVFDAIGYPPFNSGVSDAGVLVGEDEFFAARATAAGLKIWCDHGLSWEIGHVAEKVLTNEHVLADRERWLESRKKSG